jgi:hypothetical protein
MYASDKQLGTDPDAMPTLVALGDKARVKPLLLEAGLPLATPVVHHHVLDAVDETEMHILQTNSGATSIKV